MKKVKVRKLHYCDFCDKPIKKGEIAKVTTRKVGRVSGMGSYFTTYYFHENCPIRYKDRFY